MLQETTHTQKRCDGCNTVLTDRDAFVYTTDFKPTYIEKGDLHICPTCSFELMHKHVVGDIPADILKEYLQDISTSPVLGSPRSFALNPGMLMTTCDFSTHGDVSVMTPVTCSGSDDMSTGTINLNDFTNLNTKA